MLHYFIGIYNSEYLYMIKCVVIDFIFHFDPMSDQLLSPHRNTASCANWRCPMICRCKLMIALTTARGTNA